jgi:flagella basal body P-ring formation protein FlgA
MEKKAEWWGLLLVLVMWWPAAAFGLEVEFRSEAVVGGEMLTIGDVADIRPRGEAAKVSGTPLFPAPSAGERRCFKSRTLKAYIMQAVDGNSGFSWAGADEVCVRGEAVLIEAESIQSVIDERLRAALWPLGAKRVRFKLRSRPGPLSLPEGDVSYKVVFSDRDILESRKATVIVRVDGRVRENLSLAGRVEAYLPVVVAARGLSRGTILARSDLAVREKNITGLSDPCLDIDSVAGKSLARALSVNQAVSRNDLDQPIMIKRREIVTMVIEKGPLRISARGEAASAGRRGEVIMVRNMRSEREVPCRVIGGGLARVEF